MSNSSYLLQIELRNEKNLSYQGHRVSAKFEQKIASEEDETGFMWFPNEIFSDLSDDGKATLTLPPKDDVSPIIRINVIAPDGEVLCVYETHTAKIQRDKISISVDPKEPLTIQESDDPYFGKPDKIRGRVIEEVGRRQISNRQVILWGAKVEQPESKDFQPLVISETDGKGYFSGIYPLDKFTEAYGTVSVEDEKTIPIHLEDDGTFPEYVILVVKCEDETEAEYEAALPRFPDQKDLTQSEGTYSGDLGIGKCIDFHVPNRTLEEYNYYYVVRTTEPVIKGLTLEEPKKVPFAELEKQFGIAAKISGLKFLSNPGFVATVKPTIDTAEKTVPLNLSKVNSSVLKSVISDPSKLTEKNIAKVATISVYRDLERIIDLARVAIPGRGTISAKTPVDWDCDPTFYQATTVAHGHILHFKQEWVADGYSLGDLVYSLPLGPGQKKQIAVLDWERRESATRTELLTEEEKLQAILSHDRDINEIVNSALRESMRGGSTAKTSSFGGGLGLGFVGAGIGGLLGIGGGSSKASSTAWQNSSRTLAANSLQALRDKTSQAASASRSQRSTVVQTVKQGERVEAQTEIIANYNHCHAITIQYFEVLRHLLVRHRLADVQECLFVPLTISRFDSEKALRWRESLEALLERPKLRKGFQALERMENNYEGSDLPTGMYADENIEYLEGELKLKVQLSRPRDPIDEYEEPAWDWMGRLLPWINPREFYNRYLKAQAEKDRIFHEHLGQRILENFVKHLGFYAVCSGNRVELPIDATLVSNYHQNGVHHISLRLGGELPNLRRKDVESVEISCSSKTVSVFGQILLIDLLPANSKVTVHSGVMRYRTKHLSTLLFNNSHIYNDLAGDDNVRIHTPLTSLELRNPREEDKEISRQLLDHLNEYLEHYHKVIWWNMSPDRRYMLLDGFIAPNSGGRSIASVVENNLIGIVGNCLIMPISQGNHLDPTYNQKDVENPIDLLEHYTPNTPLEPVRIALPTKGVFAEAVMGVCNSCEPIEETRFWRWEESPIPDQPTAIQPISTETRRAEPPDMTAKGFPTPMINLQNAPAAPDPTGLAAAIQALITPNLFRDITGLTQNQLNALAALQSSLQTAQAFGEKAGDLALQSRMNKDIDKSMKTIKEAKTDGLITEDQAKELAGSAIRAQIGAGPTPTKTTPTDRTEVKSLLNTASEVMKSKDQASEVEASVYGAGENVALKVKSAALATEILGTKIRFELSNSVGQGGVNDPIDVRTLKQRLDELGFDWVASDDKIGADAVEVIKLFQAIKNGHRRISGHPENDGLVEVGKNTYGWLQAINAPRWQLMPVGSYDEGFSNVERMDPGDQHDYGTNWMAQTIVGAGASYKRDYLDTHPASALLTINDVSLPHGGNTPDHSGHETGLDCDIRLPKKDGTSPPMTWNDPGKPADPNPDYDQDAMRAILKAIKSQPLVSRVLFNDPDLIAEGLCIASAGHDNHAHFEIKPPERGGIETIDVDKSTGTAIA